MAVPRKVLVINLNKTKKKKKSIFTAIMFEMDDATNGEGSETYKTDETSNGHFWEFD